MSFLTDDFGKKIKLPPWERIDPTQNQIDTATGNQAAVPAASAFASDANAAILANLEKMFGLSSGMFQKIAENIGAGARGEIPQDVQDQILGSNAAKSLYGGYGGTGMSKNLTLRDLGLTSLGQQARAQDSFSKWLSTIDHTFVDVRSSFLTPEQRYAQAGNERDLEWKYKYLKAQIAAMPDPGTRGVMDAVRAAGIAYLGGNYQTGTNYTNPQGTQSPSGGGGGGYYNSDPSGFPAGSDNVGAYYGGGNQPSSAFGGANDYNG